MGDEIAALPSFHGRVIDEEGRPLVDAALRLFAELRPSREVSPRLLDSVRSDADGRFRFEEVPPLHRLWVEVTAAGVVVCRVPLASLGYLGARRLADPVPLDDLRVPARAAELDAWPRTPDGLIGKALDKFLHDGDPPAGLVIDIDGEPIRGAVVLRWDPSQMAPEVLATTGLDGRFQIPDASDWPRVQVCHRAGAQISFADTAWFESPVGAFLEDLPEIRLAPFEAIELVFERDGDPARPEAAHLEMLRRLGPPLTSSSAPGESVEERTAARTWWTSIDELEPERIEFEATPAAWSPYGLIGRTPSAGPWVTPLSFPVADEPPSLGFAAPHRELLLRSPYVPEHDRLIWGRVAWPEGPVVIDLDPKPPEFGPGVRLTGIVTDLEGTPLPDVPVKAWFDRFDGQWPARSTASLRSGPDGRFEMVDVVPFRGAVVVARTDERISKTVDLTGRPLLDWERTEPSSIEIKLELGRDRWGDADLGVPPLADRRELKGPPVKSIQVVDPTFRPMRGCAVIGPDEALLGLTNADGFLRLPPPVEGQAPWNARQLIVIAKGGGVARLLEPDTSDSWERTGSLDGEGLLTPEGLQVLMDHASFSLPDAVFVAGRVLSLELRFVRAGQPFDPTEDELLQFRSFLERRLFRGRSGLFEIERRDSPGRARLVFGSWSDSPRIGVYHRSARTLVPSTGLEAVPEALRERQIHFDTPSGVLQIPSQPELVTKRVLDVVFPTAAPGDR